MPTAIATIAAPNSARGRGLGSLPFTSASENTATTADTTKINAITVEAMAPIVTAFGRSPSRSGSSASRACWLRSSERLTGAPFARSSGAGAPVSGAAPTGGGWAERCLRLASSARFRSLLPTVLCLDLGPAIGVEHVDDRTRRRPGVRRVPDRPHHAHPPRARGRDLTHVVGVHAADCEPRQRRGLRRLPDQLQTGRRPPLLGRRLPDRPDADVVDGFRMRGLDLLAAVGGEPDDHVGPEALADLGRRHVVLADVNAVRPQLAGEVGVVVDDERRPVGVGEAAKGLAGAPDRVLAEL